MTHEVDPSARGRPTIARLGRNNSPGACRATWCFFRTSPAPPGGQNPSPRAAPCPPLLDLCTLEPRPESTPEADLVFSKVRDDSLLRARSEPLAQCYRVGEVFGTHLGCHGWVSKTPPTLRCLACNSSRPSPRFELRAKWSRDGGGHRLAGACNSSPRHSRVPAIRACGRSRRRELPARCRLTRSLRRELVP